MTIEVSSFTDDFNRAGPSMGANWDNGIQGYLAAEIISNRLQHPSPGGNYVHARYNAETFSPNVFAEFDLYGLSQPGIYGEMSISLRASETPDTQYYCNIWIDTMDSRVYHQLAVAVAGSWDYLHDDYVNYQKTDLVDGSTFRVEAYGTSFVFTINGKRTYVQNNSTIDGISTNGVHFWLYADALATDIILDNFRVGDLTSVQHKLLATRSNLVALRHKDSTKKHNYQSMRHQT